MTNGEHDIRERSSMLIYVRIIVIAIFVVLAFIFFLYEIIGNRSPVIYGLLALGSLILAAFFHWLVIGQVHKGLERARRYEIDLVSQENTLRESEEKFRAFIEESSEGVVLTDEQGIVVEWNRVMESITGISKNTALGQYAWDLQSQIIVQEHLTELLAEATKSLIVEALTTGSSLFTKKTMEAEIQNLSGEHKIVEQSTFTIKSDKGHWIGTIFRDITQRKSIERLQAAIYRISEAANTVSNLDELYPIIHSSISDLMPAKNFYIALYIPSTGLLHFPYHADEIEPDAEWPPIKPGKGLTNYVYRTGKALLVTPEVYAQLEEAGEIELIGKKPSDWMGVPLSTQNGKIGVMAVQTYNPKERLSESDKDVLMFVSTQIAMVIERRKVEDELRTSQANLEDAQRLAHIGSWELNLLTGEITFSNELYKIVGVEPGAITSLDILLQRIHPEDLAQAQAALNNSLEENQPYSLDHRLIHPDGVELIIHSQSEVIFNDSGQPVHRLGTLQDITEVRRVGIEREKLIRELQSKNTELDRFTYTVSHDLRSPLVTIRGFLGFMEKDLKAGKTERITTDMARITTAANKMQIFLDELLQLSRAGRIMNPPEPVSFRVIAMDTLEMLRGRIEARRVQVDIADDLPVILCDRIRMTQVVQNLVDNAVKFLGGQPNPQIVIGTEGKDSEGKAVLFVRDNGIGIEPQYKEKVFDLFDKLDPQTEGTGIGLTLVKRIIEAHNGRVWLKSGGAGSGSTFYFSCPIPDDEVAK